MVQSLYCKDPLEKETKPTPVFLPRKSHGQRSLVGYNPQVTESWTRLSVHAMPRIADLQGCVSFKCSAQCFSYIYVLFQILFLYRLLQYTE